MHMYSLPMELICVMSTTILLVNSLPLTGLARNWIPGADDSENDVSSPFYDSLSHHFASKALLSLGSKALNHPLRNAEQSYPVQREFDSLKDNLVEMSKPMAKRQQGWYNPYGKRGFEPLPPTSSKIWSAGYYLDPRLMSILYYPSERRTYHQETDGMLNPKADHAFGTPMKNSARRKDSGETGDVLPSTNDSTHVMTQELAALKQKLRDLYRTFTTDVSNRQGGLEMFHDVDSTPWLEKFNRAQQFESS